MQEEWYEIEFELTSPIGITSYFKWFQGPLLSLRQKVRNIITDLKEEYKDVEVVHVQRVED